MTRTVDTRQRQLLDGWEAVASQYTSGRGFDFSEDRHTERLETRLDAFLTDPNERTFEAFWSPETFRGAVMGGPSLVRKSWESVEDFAAFAASIRDADAYDPTWEDNFVTGSMI